MFFFHFSVNLLLCVKNPSLDISGYKMYMSHISCFITLFFLIVSALESLLRSCSCFSFIQFTNQLQHLLNHIIIAMNNSTLAYPKILADTWISGLVCQKIILKLRYCGLCSNFCELGMIWWPSKKIHDMHGLMKQIIRFLC